MKYALLIYGNEVANAKRPEAEQQQEFQDYFAFEGEIAQRNVKDSGEALWDTSKATTIRVRDGKTLTTDGPFAETKEQLGGYYILNCKDLDEAIELAAKIPGAKHGSIEIRPVWEVPAQM